MTEQKRYLDKAGLALFWKKLKGKSDDASTVYSLEGVKKYAEEQANAIKITINGSTLVKAGIDTETGRVITLSDSEKLTNAVENLGAPGNPADANGTAFARIAKNKELIEKLSQATQFIGIYNQTGDLPIAPNKIITDKFPTPGRTPLDGDIVIRTAEGYNGKEFIYSANKWEELGDTSAERADINRILTWFDPNDADDTGVAKNATHAAHASTLGTAENLVSIGDSRTPAYFTDGKPVLADEMVGKIDKTADASNHGEIFNSYNSNSATGKFSHAEGFSTRALGEQSHAEGDHVSALGKFSHAEGQETVAGGWQHNTTKEIIANDVPFYKDNYTLVGNISHAEGANTNAFGNNSHAEGFMTITLGSSAHAEGRANVVNENWIHMVGIGSGSSSRQNAHTIDNDGKHYILGIGGYTGTEKGTPESPLPVNGDLATVINNMPATAITSDEIDDIYSNPDSYIPTTA